MDISILISGVVPHRLQQKINVAVNERIRSKRDSNLSIFYYLESISAYLGKPPKSFLRNI
jgi:hypothetical protein